MAKVKRLIKLGVANILYYLGIMWLRRGVLTRLQRGRTLVLVYHSVVDEQEPRSLRDRRSGLAVSRENFQKQMEYLARNYRVVPLSRLVTGLRGGPAPPPNACVITFDDGFEDNYRNAFPVLRRLGLPATFFLATGFLDTNRVPWYVEFSELVSLLPGSGFHSRRLPPDTCPSDVMRLLDSLAGGNREAEGPLLEVVKQLPAERIAHILTALKEHLGYESLPERITLSWEEVHRMSAVGMSFGGHTRNHTILTVETEVTAEEEVFGAKQDLEANLGHRVEGFAYPNGACDAFVKRLVERAGFDYACGMGERSADLHSDRYAIPRRDINEAKSTGLTGRFSPAVFEAVIQGLFDCVSPRRWAGKHERDKSSSSCSETHSVARV